MDTVAPTRITARSRAITEPMAELIGAPTAVHTAVVRRSVAEQPTAAVEHSVAGAPSILAARLGSAAAQLVVDSTAAQPVVVFTAVAADSTVVVVTGKPHRPKARSSERAFLFVRYFMIARTMLPIFLVASGEARFFAFFAIWSSSPRLVRSCTSDS